MTVYPLPACPCCNHAPEMPEWSHADRFITRLSDVEYALGDFEFDLDIEGLTVTSGWRCKAYNKKIGGHPNSAHMRGTAADILCVNSRYRAILIGLCIEMGLSVGIYERHLHIDLRDNPVVWVA